jgi:hypothetical protein
MSPKKSSITVVKFITEILRFAKKGEKTGWTYVDIPSHIAAKLFPGNKKSFRVKGYLAEHPIKGIALIPMGEGNFIMPLNATIRKAIKKRNGDRLSLRLQVDLKEPTIKKTWSNASRAIRVPSHFLMSFLNRIRIIFPSGSMRRRPHRLRQTGLQES